MSCLLTLAEFTNISNNVFVVYGYKEINDAGIGTIKFGNSSVIGMDFKNNMVPYSTIFSNNAGIGTANAAVTLNVNGAFRLSMALSGKVTYWKADRTIGSCYGTAGSCNGRMYL